MSEHDPNAAPPSSQEPPNDWGQLPPEWQQQPGQMPPPPPPPPGYQQPSYQDPGYQQPNYVQPGQLPPPPPPGYQQPYTPYNPYGQQYAERTEPLAIASLVVSLVGIACFGMVTGLVGIGLGVAARNRIDRDPTLKGKGLATAGIIVGACVFALSILGIILLTRSNSV